MRTRISFTIQSNLKKDFEKLGGFAKINTYAKKAFISKVMNDKKEKILNEKVNRIRKRFTKKQFKKYPDWLEIDTYDDLGARSAKRTMQALWDRNPKCRVCGMELQHHVDINGNSNQDHLFGEKK